MKVQHTLLRTFRIPKLRSISFILGWQCTDRFNRGEGDYLPRQRDLLTSQ